MATAEAQPRASALLLASAGDSGWVADAAAIVRQLGFTVRADASMPAPLPDIAADVGLVMASAAAGIPLSLMQAWRAGGAVCAVVLPPGAAPADAAAQATVASVRAPVTEAALLAMLASQRYVALCAHEAAGIAAAIAGRTFGNPAFADELLQALVTSTRDDLARLRQAGGDLDTVRGVAHRLKASAHYVGCDALRLMTQRLEHAARDGDEAIAAALAAIVVPTVARLLTLLTNLSVKMPPINP